MEQMEQSTYQSFVYICKPGSETRLYTVQYTVAPTLSGQGLVFFIAEIQIIFGTVYIALNLQNMLFLLVFGSGFTKSCRHIP